MRLRDGVASFVIFKRCALLLGSTDPPAIPQQTEYPTRIRVLPGPFLTRSKRSTVCVPRMILRGELLFLHPEWFYGMKELSTRLQPPASKPLIFTLTKFYFAVYLFSHFGQDFAVSEHPCPSATEFLRTFRS